MAYEASAIVVYPRLSYIRACVLSVPPWADRNAINALRDEARRLTALTGERYVLDHIVPLTHPYVCGLTVPWNLQVLPHRVNAAKSNKFHPDQLEFSFLNADTLPPLQQNLTVPSTRKL